jgi:hypothetical protein
LAYVIEASMFENVAGASTVFKDLWKLITAIARALRRSRRRITASFTPKDIHDAVRGMSTLSRPSVYEHYAGHRICWHCSLSKVTPDGKRPRRANVELTFHAGVMNRYLIRCSVIADKYQGLEIGEEPKYVQIFGRIDKITDDAIELTDVELIFVSPG